VARQLNDVRLGNDQLTSVQYVNSSWHWFQVQVPWNV